VQRIKNRPPLEPPSMGRLSLVLSVASLLFGVLVYVGSVAGLLWAKPTPVADHGVIPVAAIFVLFGLAGLLLGRGKGSPTA
jgi:hypothetical protein